MAAQDGPGTHASPCWSSDVAQACAQGMSMPGLENLQQQYVRYSGQTSATHTESGWMLKQSENANKHSASLNSSAPLCSSTDLPQQVQLTITTAPAEFCLPTKSDRQFKPCFQVQVRVVHGGYLHLPLRLKAFAVLQDDMDDITKWLPEELRVEDEAAPASLNKMPSAAVLKGSTVASYIFETSTTTTGLPMISQVPQMPSIGGRVNPSGAPLNFPSKASKATPRERVLSSNDSIRSQLDDPEMATPLDLGSVCNTVVAQYEFKSLEFAKPTRMNPAYIVFACLVADRDLLFVTYEVPCIAICRAEQRAKAITRLGLPLTCYYEIKGFNGKVPPNWSDPPVLDKGAAVNAAKAAHTDGPGAADYSRKAPSTSMVQQWVDINREEEKRRNNRQRQHAAAIFMSNEDDMAGIKPGRDMSSMQAPPSNAAQNRMDPSQSALFAPPGHPMHSMSTGIMPGMSSFPQLDFDLGGAPSDLVNLPSLSLPGVQSHLPDHHGRASGLIPNTFDPLASLSQNPAGGPGVTTGDLRHAPSDYDRMVALLRANSLTLPMSTPPAAAGVLPPAEHLTSAMGSAVPPAAARVPKRSNSASGESIDPNDPPYEPPGSVRRASNDHATASGPRSVRRLSDSPVPISDLGGGGGAPPPRQEDSRISGGGFDPAIAAPSDGSAGAGPGSTTSGAEGEPRGVSQVDAYQWLTEHYNATALQRRLQRQDVQALLSLAGFPTMAGLDRVTRVHPRQFQEFQQQYLSALAMLRNIATLWNLDDPCVVSGFDMDRRRAVAALTAQPTGTFICRFSITKPGTLVLSCKVDIGTPQADGDMLHMTINLDDLAKCKVEQMILNVPYASHILDVYTNRRVDKRLLLQTGYLRVTQALSGNNDVVQRGGAGFDSGGAMACSPPHAAAGSVASPFHEDNSKSQLQV